MWKTDRWFTSPWNFAPEVRKELHFADKVRLHDVTLRDGEVLTQATVTRGTALIRPRT